MIQIRDREECVGFKLNVEGHRFALISQMHTELSENILPYQFLSTACKLGKCAEILKPTQFSIVFLVSILAIVFVFYSMNYLNTGVKLNKLRFDIFTGLLGKQVYFPEFSKI